MLVSELRDRVLVESGNLFLADLSMLGVNPSQFLTMLRTTLSSWSDYRFLTGNLVVPVTNGVVHLGEVHAAYVKYLKDVAAGIPSDPVPRLDAIPSLISDISLVKYAGYFDTQTLSYQYAKPVLKVIGASGELVNIEWKAPFSVQNVGKYSPSIPTAASAGSTTMPEAGTWNPNFIPSLTQPREVASSAPEDELELWEIPGLEESDRAEEFIQLMTGKFMVILGRSRRGFQLNDMPVQLDSDMMVSEGQTIIDRVTEQMQETSDVFDTILQTPVAGW